MTHRTAVCYKQQQDIAQNTLTTHYSIYCNTPAFHKVHLLPTSHSPFCHPHATLTYSHFLHVLCASIADILAFSCNAHLNPPISSGPSGVSYNNRLGSQAVTSAPQYALRSTRKDCPPAPASIPTSQPASPSTEIAQLTDQATPQRDQGRKEWAVDPPASPNAASSSEQSKRACR